jgi:sirohydrochlorin cobaltochelatase
MKAALVLFAHGAREAAWAAPFRSVRDRVAAQRSDLTVELAFLELMAPPLEDCVERLVAAGHRRITVAPMFLGMGGHLRRDLPQCVERLRNRHAGIEFITLPPIGEAEALLEAAAHWLVNGVSRPGV